ncbi:hypothetical protein G8O24_19190 [Bradyrhizobium sp. INPA01-394B]|uniref:Uncharacterized protein n=1 Tax=Bradyrhizobium campsiandrae TaxID=1729892 RepID=A0ABR7UKZ4_9BRAD|nr:hypothetical protein [Bradyrhizobium campsiandrae]MBC9879468.1 hypothetical protein [Bradyrhizobium campsiandrae]MBC9984042.1 hypothetical protein [Bradyrhizobium campsiandrae]
MSTYYYAGGQKVDLEPDQEHVAVDQAAAKEAGLDAKVSPDSSTAMRAGAGVLVTPRSSLAPDILRLLQEAGALQPVYRRDKAVVVAMPEVRVEFDTPAQRRKVMKFLSPNASDVSVTEDTKDRLVLRPVSGHGEDALNLANSIQEHAKPAAASVRFVQFVPKPGTIG